MILPAHIAQRIREAVAQGGLGSPIDDEARGHDAIALMGTIGAIWMLRPDGTLWDADADFGKPLTPLPDGFRVTALVAGAERFSWLAELLPTRPQDAADCSLCSGRGILVPVDSMPGSSGGLLSQLPGAGLVVAVQFRSCCEREGMTIRNRRRHLLICAAALSSAVAPVPPAMARPPLAPISVAAADAIRSVAGSARRKDFVGLRALMTDQFTWSFGGDLDANQAIDEWKRDPRYLRELSRVLRRACRPRDADHVECPGRGGLTFRAGFVKTDPGWKLEFFVEGD